MTATRRKRDLTQAQFEYRLQKAGWTREGFMGYWKAPSGIAVSAWNYGRRRDALREMARIDREHAARKQRAQRAAEQKQATASRTVCESGCSAPVATQPPAPPAETVEALQIHEQPATLTAAHIAQAEDPRA